MIKENKKIFIKLAITICCLALIIITIYAIDTPYRNSRKLIDAIEANDVTTAVKILESNQDPDTPSMRPLNILSFWGITPELPLSIACRNGNYDMVNLLLTYGASANGVDGVGRTPMRETLAYFQEDDVKIVELLLENGADTETQNDLWPVCYAAKMTPKEYDPAKENGTVFKGDYSEAIAQDITEIVLLLLEDRDPNIAHAGGTTLLMYAASVGNVCLVNRLLSMGADDKLTNNAGETAYDIAIKNGHQDVVILLERTKE